MPETSDTPEQPAEQPAEQPDGPDDDFSLRITQVQARPHPVEEGKPDPLRLELRLGTSRGEISALLDVSEGQPGAVVFCSGAMGGAHEVIGPGGRVYERLAGELPGQGVSTLRFHYRMAGGVRGMRAGCAGGVLVSGRRGRGADRAGGALVRRGGGDQGGADLPSVCGVVSLSPQLFGTRQVEQLGKPLLLVHGTADGILHHAASEDIYKRAQDPKRLVLIPDGGHGLAEDPETVHRELSGFIRQLAGPRSKGGVAEGEDAGSDAAEGRRRGRRGGCDC